MHITDVTVELVDTPAMPSFQWRAGLPGSEPAGIGGVLRIHTDTGLVGESRTPRGVIVADLVQRRIRADLAGRDPLAREALWQRMWELDRIEEFPVYTLGLVDTALWDLAGKHAGLPVHQLLGTFRDAIPACASTVTFGSVEEFLDVADQCLALGYPAVKLHAWGDARRDAELCQKLRAHVGDAVPLMYDGSAGFDLADAVYLGRALSEAGYLWYEEPMREFSITAYRRLAERVDIPLLVAETSDGAHWNVADFIAAGTATHVRTSDKFKGGITGAMRIAHLADSFQLRAEVHGSGLASAHLCMAIPNTTYYESLVYTNPVVREPLVGPDGLVRAPSAPGIGWETAD
ncbi:L-alanine-DL-glutamate epimerase-like enolase superfamily enzyme [Catenulispora sp. MAP12-49]|uniref:enolase C-terminal domain-like protein n=1 Tax=Catenulispora sp. MAP12-49 TaxID=3156302 RepID=UPI0035139618